MKFQPKPATKKRRSQQHAGSPALECLEERVLLSAEFAPIDGFANNNLNPEWGSTDTALLRLTTVEYGDGVWTPAASERPSPRVVSNEVVAQTESIVNDRYMTDLVWLWGQFVDHDIDLTENGTVPEAFPIEVPAGDPWFDPFNTGTATIDLNRSIYDTTTGDALGNPRQQINQITAFIDGSNVYGSDEIRAAALRTFAGGQLKTSEGGLLPFNAEGLPNAGGTGSNLFLAGDVRANENVALTAMHTLWVREHNRLADEIESSNPEFSDEQIYQQARRIVIAEIQAITYNEFLPTLLGFGAIDAYEGYDPEVNPGIANIFSTAAYRLGHSLLSPELLRLNDDGTEIAAGNLPLQSGFFAPQEIVAHGIDSLLKGASSQLAQELDNHIVDDVRNFLFGPPGAGGFDLASLNIQRGRDHGLPDYNQARIDLGLEAVTTFADITSNVELQQTLAEVYGDVDNIDVWVGGLAEDHLPSASVGELFHTILVDQFTRLRDGDRFWYEATFSGDELAAIQNTRLSDVLARNTDLTDLRANVFLDESVMFVEMPAGTQAGVTLQMQHDRVVVLDSQTEAVVDSRRVSDMSQVMLVGRDHQDDRFVISIQDANCDQLEGLMVYGGDGDSDTLIVEGTRGRDQIMIDGATLTINGSEVDVSEIETIRIRDIRGNDRVQILNDGGADVLIERGQHGHHGHHRGSIGAHVRERNHRGHRDQHRPAPTSSRGPHKPLSEVDHDGRTHGQREDQREGQREESRADALGRHAAVDHFFTHHIGSMLHRM